MKKNATQINPLKKNLMKYTDKDGMFCIGKNNTEIYKQDKR